MPQSKHACKPMCGKHTKGERSAAGCWLLAAYTLLKRNCSSHWLLPTCVSTSNSVGPSTPSRFASKSCHRSFLGAVSDRAPRCLLLLPLSTAAAAAVGGCAAAVPRLAVAGPCTCRWGTSSSMLTSRNPPNSSNPCRLRTGAGQDRTAGRGWLLVTTGVLRGAGGRSRGCLAAIAKSKA